MSPRGRRPASADTRGAIVEAARAEFAESGYDATSLRGVARRAGVDPALLHHYFDGKPGLFAEVLQVPANPDALIRSVAEGPLADVGERMARTFLAVWDSPEGRARFQVLIRSAVSHDDAARMLREFVVGAIFSNLVRQISLRHKEIAAEEIDVRASLAAAQMVGVGMLRYVIELPAMVEATPEELVAHLAPTLQRYLAGPAV